MLKLMENRSVKKYCNKFTTNINFVECIVSFVRKNYTPKYNKWGC